MILYTIPLLFVPKKDNNWCMCIDCRAINKIIVKYRHLILILDDIFDKLHGSSVFSKIICKMVIIKLEWKKEIKGRQHWKLKMNCLNG
jgi:hypothetical protein